MKIYNFLFLFVFSSYFSKISEEEVLSSIKRKRLRYLQALALIKQAYSILLDLENDLVVDSSDFVKALEYFELGKYYKCIPIFKSLIKKNECKFEAMFLLAESFLMTKKIKEASILYNSIICSTPDLLDEKHIKIIKYSYLKLIDCLILLKNKKDACAVIKQYIKIFPAEKNNPEIELLCRKYNCSVILVDSDSNDIKTSEESSYKATSSNNNCEEEKKIEPKNKAKKYKKHKKKNLHK